MAPARLATPVLAPEERFWRPFPFFVRPNKLLEFKLLFCFILLPSDEFSFFGLTKTETAAKTGHRVF